MDHVTETALDAYAGSFDAFYVEQFDRQARRAFLILAGDERALDVVHDAFEAVFRRWNTIEEPGPYLTRVVVNRCRDVQRRSVRLRRLQPRLAAGGEQPSEPEVLDDALRSLPFNQRAAIVLRFYADLSYAEISDALDCPTGSVGPWIDRGLRTLRRTLT